MNATTAVTATPLAFWAELLISLLLVIGALMALIGAVGLVRLKDFYARLHAPTLGATLGCACIVAATVLTFSLARSHLTGQAILISVFLIITAPLSAMLLIKVGLYRARRSKDESE